MRNKCGQNGIKWNFNPPSAPHFGGMQEAGVKSVKHHLKRILGDFTPTSEEMQTLLCKIEASLNSRPIAALSDCPEDYAPLTPGHFLIGSPINALPVENENKETEPTRSLDPEMEAQFGRLLQLGEAFRPPATPATATTTEPEPMEVGDAREALRHPPTTPTFRLDLGQDVLEIPVHDGTPSGLRFPRAGGAGHGEQPRGAAALGGTGSLDSRAVNTTGDWKEGTPTKSGVAGSRGQSPH
ncbi:uncharacterized protein LOC122404318 [Colletes gigas]|uniref:uncharacterized protein LOC122404318 n=1 Tax=Colletes gigas TaxID=935657 RepID=UPI001C9B2524|nr:uncharacterized protein LOC122404318 [Colletes gigas]